MPALRFCPATTPVHAGVSLRSPQPQQGRSPSAALHSRAPAALRDLSNGPLPSGATTHPSNPSALHSSPIHAAHAAFPPNQCAGTCMTDRAPGAAPAKGVASGDTHATTGPPKAAARGPIVCKSKVLAHRGGAKRRGGYEDDENDVLRSIAPKKRPACASTGTTLPPAPPPPRPGAVRR